MAGDGDPLVAAQDHRVDADHRSVGIDQRTSGVAGRQVDVGADDLDRLIGIAGLGGAQTADQPGGDCAALSPRVADRQHQLAHPQDVRIGD